MKKTILFWISFGLMGYAGSEIKGVDQELAQYVKAVIAKPFSPYEGTIKLARSAGQDFDQTSLSQDKATITTNTNSGSESEVTLILQSSQKARKIAGRDAMDIVVEFYYSWQQSVPLAAFHVLIDRSKREYTVVKSGSDTSLIGGWQSIEAGKKFTLTKSVTLYKEPLMLQLCIFGSNPGVTVLFGIKNKGHFVGDPRTKDAEDKGTW